jgi:hypothetical protein
MIVTTRFVHGFSEEKKGRGGVREEHMNILILLIRMCLLQIFNK